MPTAPLTVYPLLLHRRLAPLAPPHRVLIRAKTLADAVRIISALEALHRRHEEN